MAPHRKPHYDTVSRRPHRVIVFSSVTVTVVWAKQFGTLRIVTSNV